jgi:hypothetical protein
MMMRRTALAGIAVAVLLCGGVWARAGECYYCDDRYGCHDVCNGDGHKQCESHSTCQGDSGCTVACLANGSPCTVSSGGGGKEICPGCDAPVKTPNGQSPKPRGDAHPSDRR